MAQSADKLYKSGDVEQGLIAAANYRIGCEIFVRLVDGANELRCHILTMPHARETVIAYSQRSRHFYQMTTLTKTQSQR